MIDKANVEHSQPTSKKMLGKLSSPLARGRRAAGVGTLRACA